MSLESFKLAAVHIQTHLPVDIRVGLGRLESTHRWAERLGGPSRRHIANMQNMQNALKLTEYAPCTIGWLAIHYICMHTILRRMRIMLHVC